MHLLNPFAFAWLPLIVALLLVARRRAPRPRRAVANLYLWRQTTPLDPARLALARLRRHRLLALQIAFMLVVIAALARPGVSWRPRTASPTTPTVPAEAERRIVPVPRADPIRVLLLTSGNFFLEQSLLTNPALTVDREKRPGARYEVVVCDACAAALSESAGLLTIPAPDETPPLAEPVMVSDSEHPIAAGLMSLGPDPALVTPASRSSSTVVAGDVILRAGSVPVLVSSASNRGRTVALNVNLSSSLLPLTTAFPVLMANVMEWLAARDDPSPAALTPASDTASDVSSGRGAADLLDNLSRPLLVVALAVLLVEWRYWSAQERGRQALACRAVVVALTALGAAGLALPVGEAAETVMFALDRSASLPSETQSAALARVNAMASGMRPRDRAGLVAFGADAAVERPPAASLELTEIASTISPAGTHIEAALRTARIALPRDGVRRIVLVSDGRATAGDVSRELARARAAGILVDVVPADAAAADRPLIVKSVAAPVDVRVGEPFKVSVEIAGAPGARGQLTMSGDGEAPVTREVEVAPDGTASVTFGDQRRQAGVYAYRAVLDDQAAATGAVVTVEGTPQILYAGSSAGPVAGVLASSGFLVRQVMPGALPSSASELSIYDAIVLDDVPSDRLDPAAAQAIAAYVEETGGGLLMLGGPHSLDAAGYPEGPLGRLLPIDLRPRNGQRAPSMGLVVAFDKSGSMADLVSGVAKIELARQAVRKVLDAVRSTDAIGVVAFDAAPVIVSPLAVSPDPRLLADRLRAITPGGSTAISPALGQAADWLRRAHVTRRHVLLVSDGRTPPADAERLRETVKRGGFELSVIAIGADADRSFLEELATGTGGRAYFPDDLRQLPILAAREAARAAGGGIVEERFALRTAAHPISAGLDRGAPVAMAGYVVSAVKPGAEPVLLSHLDDPVLAAWRFGLGRVAVYTADLRSPWSAGLRTWSGFSTLWLQTARWVGRRETVRALRATIAEGPDGARLVVDAETPSGPLLGQLDVHAAVRGPNGGEQEVRLRATIAGRYEAPLDTPSAGPYLASITARSSDGAVDARALRAFYWSANRERRASGADMATLAQIAGATGGRVLGPNDDPFAGPRPRAFTEVWTELAAAALLLFLLDVALRRGFTLRWRRRDREPASPSRAAA